MGFAFSRGFRPLSFLAVELAEEVDVYFGDDVFLDITAKLLCNFASILNGLRLFEGLSPLELPRGGIGGRRLTFISVTVCFWILQQKSLRSFCG